ncbi:MAG: phage holin family protein [Pseudonocardiaceae bacterium]|nr:phage holin family protein [Pseudonocardiaceae bacterium]
MHDVPQSQRSTAELIRDLGDQVTRLIRTEMRVAQRELQRKGKEAGKGAGLLGTAAVFGLLGSGTVVAGGVLLLGQAVAPWLSAVIIGAGLLGLAGVTALVARSRIRVSAPPLPEDAIDGAARDIESVKEAARK